MSPYYWPRAPLKRDRGSHAVAQRHSLGCYLPAPAMATPSISIPSTPTKRKVRERLTAPMALSRAFTDARFTIMHEVIKVQAVFLIFEER